MSIKNLSVKKLNSRLNKIIVKHYKMSEKKTEITTIIKQIERNKLQTKF